VLDPADASYPGMPRSAIESVAVDHISPLVNLGGLLDRLSREEVIDEPGDQVDEYVDVTERDPLLAGRTMPGTPSEISCPECSGTLYEVEAENVTRFACHVGHSFSPEALVDGQANALGGALWTALRTLEESALLAHRMVHRMKKRGSERAAGRFAEKERELRARAEVVRGALLESHPGPRPNEESETGGIRSIS
ncbi:MAG: chemotaxis protein CheB, partial [Actinomycetota bacterium]